MFKPWLSIVLLTLVLAPVALRLSPAAAQGDYDLTPTYFKWCNGSEPDVSLNRQVAGCTALIQSDRVDPEGRTIAFYRRGMAFLAKGLYDRAIRDFSSAIGRKPDFAEAFVGRGHAWRYKGEYDRAIRDFDAAIGLVPDDASALSNRCWVRAIAGRDLQIALADCDRSLQLRMANANTLDSRCLVNYRMGNLDAALADCNAALLIDPKYASSLYVRGLVKRRKGDTVGGDGDIAAARTLDPKIVETYAQYGVAS